MYIHDHTARLIDEFDREIKAEVSRLNRFSGDERARREELVEKARRDLIALEHNVQKGSGQKVQSRLEHTLQQLQSPTELDRIR